MNSINQNETETSEPVNSFLRSNLITAFNVNMCCFLLFFFISVFIGRSVMLLWMGDASVHELYTAACGLYFIWLVCRVGSVLLSWVPLGWKGVAGKVFEWVLLVSALRKVQYQTFNKGYYFRILDQKQKMGV